VRNLILGFKIQSVTAPIQIYIFFRHTVIWKY